MERQPVVSRVMLIGIVVALMLSCTTLRSWFRREAPELHVGGPSPVVPLPDPVRDAGVPVFPAWFPGPVLRALTVAVGDLVIRNGDPDSADAFVRCLSRPDSYDAQIVREDADRWMIYVVPRDFRCMDTDGGAHILGGDAKYEISKADFRILGVEYGE